MARLSARQEIMAELFSKLLFTESERLAFIDRQLFEPPRGLTEAQIEAMTMEKSCLEQNPIKTLRTYDGASRNGPCPCGSGKKFKRCCRTVSVDLKGKS